MEYEFDPTLTPGAQNRYAEGMPESSAPEGPYAHGNDQESANSGPLSPQEFRDAFDEGVIKGDNEVFNRLHQERSNALEAQQPRTRDDELKSLREDLEKLDPNAPRAQALQKAIESKSGNQKKIEELTEQLLAEPDLRKKIEIQRKILTEQEKVKGGRGRQEKVRAEIDADLKTISEFDAAALKDLQAQYDRLVDQDGFSKEEADALGEQIARRQAPVVAAIQNIKGDAHRTKYELTRGNSVASGFAEDWPEVEDLLAEIDKAEKDGDIAAARAAAIDVARKIRPYYQQVVASNRHENDFYWTPRNAEDLWEAVAIHQNEEFAPGGDLALVEIRQNENAPEGREIILNEANILEWLRQQILRLHKFNSTSNLGVFELVSLRTGINNLPLQELLLKPEYWLHRVKTADGGVTQKESTSYTALQDMLFMTTWLYDNSHNSGVGYRAAMGNADKLAEELGKFYSAANIFTATRGRLRDIYTQASTDTATHPDRDNAAQSEVQRKLNPANGEAYAGQLGKAARAMQLSYDYMAEVMMVEGSTQYWRMKDEDKGKYLNNLFLESLGTEGAPEFYKTIIRDVFLKDYGGTFSVAEELIKGLNVRRKDWEQFDILDLLFQGEEAFVDRLTPQLKERYKSIKDRLEASGKHADFKAQMDSLKEGKSGALKALASKKLFNISLEDGRFTGGFARWMEAFANGSIDEKAFAVELARQRWAPTGGDTNDVLNVFSLKKKAMVTQRVRDAIVRAMVKEYKLRTGEVEFAEGQVFDLAYLLGSAAKNDVNGITFDKWSEWMNSGRYRDGQTEFKNAFGNPVSIAGLRKLSFTYLEGARVRKAGENEYSRSFKQILQGGTGDEMRLKEDIAVFDFEENASVQFLSDHISFVNTWNKALSTLEIEFNKILTHDPRTGAAVKNFEAFQDFINKYWKPLRYFLYNTNPPFKEEFRSWQYKAELGLGYKVNRPSTVTTKSLEKLMFSDEILDLEMPDNANKVLLYMLGAQISLHLPPLCYRFGYKKYGVEEVQELYDIFSKASRSTLIDGQKIDLILPVINEEQWKDMLKKVARTRWWKLYFDSYGWDASGMFKDIFTDLFGQFFKSIAILGK